MFRKIQIWLLKRRLRGHVLRFNNDYMFYQCGNALLNEITGGRFLRDKVRIESLKEKLRSLDPNFPQLDK